jgi:membrane protein
MASDEDHEDGEDAWRAPTGPPHRKKGSLGQTLKRTLTEFKEDNLTDRAAGLTYYSVLSIFPAMIALVSIVGLVGDPESVTETVTDIVTSIGPSSAADTFAEPIEDVTRSSGTAGIALVIGIAAALWTASGYVGAFMRVSNEIYEVEEGRGMLKLRPLQLVVTLVLVVLLAVTVAAVALTGPVADPIGDRLGLGSTAITAWDIAKWPVLAVIVSFMLALLYYSAPNARLPGFRWITPGSVVAIVVWLMASAGFAVFVANFGSYNKTYGALGGVVVFLVWLWISNIVILLGAEFNSELERGRAIQCGMRPEDREPFAEPRDTRKMESPYSSTKNSNP